MQKKNIYSNIWAPFFLFLFDSFVKMYESFNCCSFSIGFKNRVPIDFSLLKNSRWIVWTAREFVKNLEVLWLGFGSRKGGLSVVCNRSNNFLMQKKNIYSNIWAPFFLFLFDSFVKMYESFNCCSFSIGFKNRVPIDFSLLKNSRTSVVRLFYNRQKFRVIFQEIKGSKIKFDQWTKKVQDGFYLKFHIWDSAFKIRI